MENSDQYFECNDPNVIFERFDDETILVNLDSGRYYSLDPVGVVVWELINRPMTVGDLLDKLKAHYDGEAARIETAIREFISLLEAEGLIRPRREPPPAGVDDGKAIAQDRTFAPPVLAKYEDMAEMLLLDPVHDVDDAGGWPQQTEAPAKPTGGDTAVRVENDDASSWPSLDDEK
jgi:hypothetical protein